MLLRDSVIQTEQLAMFRSFSMPQRSAVRTSFSFVLSTRPSKRRSPVCSHLMHHAETVAILSLVNRSTYPNELLWRSACA